MCVIYEKRRLTENYSKIKGPKQWENSLLLEMGSRVDARTTKSSIIDP